MWENLRWDSKLKHNSRARLRQWVQGQPPKASELTAIRPCNTKVRILRRDFAIPLEAVIRYFDTPVQATGPRTLHTHNLVHEIRVLFKPAALPIYDRHR